MFPIVYPSFIAPLVLILHISSRFQTWRPYLLLLGEVGQIGEVDCIARRPMGTPRELVCYHVCFQYLLLPQNYTA
ncbi:hypothetical protein EDC01DRAFT_661132 [Geopyxis carbonaria]|nr:hypothetical protein EDC01DRAFT_661132 [Geopyxis carbonaria]